MANESGSVENLCFFITRIGEEGSSDREQADGVLDAIVKPAAKELGLECVRADQRRRRSHTSDGILARSRK